MITATHLPTIHFKQLLNLNVIGEYLEIMKPGNTGANQEGNWKLIVNANSKLDLQKCKPAGNWVMVQDDYF